MILRDNKYLFEHEEKHYYKQVRESHFWNNNFIEHENNLVSPYDEFLSVFQRLGQNFEPPKTVLN